MASARILALLLVVHGSNYVKKFADKSGGFIILKQRLRIWWNLPAIWTISFALLFGVDVARIDFEQDFNLQNLSAIFPSDSVDVKHPQMLPVLSAMLENGLRAVVKTQTASSPAYVGADSQSATDQGHSSRPKHLRQRSMSLNGDFASRSTAVPSSSCRCFFVLTGHRISSTTLRTTQRSNGALDHCNPFPCRSAFELFGV